MQLAGAILFLISAIALFYVAVGYPLVLMLLARRPKPVFPKPFLPTVNVLLPVHNGAVFMRQKLESILALDYPRELMTILVISDGSDDGTDEIVREFAGRGIELLPVARGGKARALNSGLERATGEIIFFTDVRQTLDSGSLRHLMTYFADPAVGVVSGELIIRDGRTQEEVHTGLYWKYEKWIRRRQSQIDSVTGATGCIYAMRRSLTEPLPVNTLLDDVFLPAGAYLKGYRVLWTDGAKAFDYPTPLGVEYPRKVRTQAGTYQVAMFRPSLLNPFRNRIWLHFASHRMGRLLLPFLMFGIAVGTFALPQPWMMMSIGAQLLFYAMVLADPYIPDGGALKRLTSISRTFMVMVAAAFAAASVLFQPNKEFWPVTRINTPAGSQE